MTKRHMITLILWQLERGIITTEQAINLLVNVHLVNELKDLIGIENAADIVKQLE